MAKTGNTIFFSYSREDADFAIKLATDLRKNGINIWIDTLDIITGERWDRAIEKALESSPLMLVILSPQSVSSANVMDEVSYALEERKTTIPILYKECKVPFRLRRLHRIDFTSSYDQGLIRLVEDIKHKYYSLSGATNSDTSLEEMQKIERDSSIINPEETKVPQGQENIQTTNVFSKIHFFNSSPKRAILFGAILGILYGAISFLIVYNDDPRMKDLGEFLKYLSVYSVISLNFGALTGFINGKDIKVWLPILFAVASIVVIWIIAFGTYEDTLITGLVFGGGVTSILTALVWKFLRKKDDQQISQY